MKALVIGASAAAEELAEALRTAGIEAAVAEPAGGSASEIAALAHELVSLEATLSGGGIDAVVLADSGDRSLAGALVATKLLIPVAAVEDGDRAPNERLLALLADRVLPGDPAGIVAWARSASPGSAAPGA